MHSAITLSSGRWTRSHGGGSLDLLLCCACSLSPLRLKTVPPARVPNRVPSIARACLLITHSIIVPVLTSVTVKTGLGDDAMGEEVNRRVAELGQVRSDCHPYSGHRNSVSRLSSCCHPQVSDSPDQLTRTFYSPAHCRAADLLIKWMVRTSSSRLATVCRSIVSRSKIGPVLTVVPVSRSSGGSGERILHVFKCCVPGRPTSPASLRTQSALTVMCHPFRVSKRGKMLSATFAAGRKRVFDRDTSSIFLLAFEAPQHSPCPCRAPELPSLAVRRRTTRMVPRL